MPKVPSPRGARPRHDVRPRVLAALTPEPSTANEIAERAGIPGRERAVQATRALEHLEAEGLAYSVIRRTRTRWCSVAVAPASERSERDPAG
jgi:hypothetical protein